MKWFKKSVFFVLILIIHADASVSHSRKMRHELAALYEQLDILKSSYLNDIQELRKEFQELKNTQKPYAETTNERNEKLTLEWARNSMHELRVELREMGKTINSSALLHQLHSMHNQIKRVISETGEMLNLDRTQEARIDKLDSNVERLKYEKQEMRNILEQHRINLTKLSKEVHAKQYPEADMSVDIDEHMARSDAGPLHPERHHKYRHNKMVHAQIARLAKAQDQIDMTQQTMQTQMLDLTRRLDRLEEPNWNLVTAKIDLLELQAKVFSDRLNNNTMAVSDFEKVHASTLELREDVESLENKIDKTIPEFRKEISKLDVCVAQSNAHFSYVKEGQENLRQSVKAIAVSVSNAVERAEEDRDELRKVASSVIELQARTKQHYYRLNDHIQKSEANETTVVTNSTQNISLPELMDEVKELQPVEHEYEDLVGQLPRDCTGVSGPSGLYLIHPGLTPFDAWCHNGTTLLQRRYNGTVEFNRKFAEYATGFGNPASEYWIGLDTMHGLTSDNCSSMRIDMTDIYGAVWYAQYDNFYVGSADTGYVLEVSGFKGNASDAFEYQNHMEFSAIDRDRDISNTHCAGNYEGGWWFSHCQHVNINGKYNLGLTWFDGTRNEWIAVATSEMTMHRRPGCA